MIKIGVIGSLTIIFGRVSLSWCQTTLAVQVPQETIVTNIGGGTVGTVCLAQIILPDGSHAKAGCVSMADGCGEIESFAPEHMKPDDKKCALKAVGDGLSQFTCEIHNLGSYQATREANDLLIKVPKGIVRYHTDGSW
jgi:hypothetical protein